VEQEIEKKNFDKRPNLRQKFIDEENRTARKSHCEPVERHQCNIHRKRRSAVCRTTTTTTTSVSSLLRRQSDTTLE